MGQAFSAMPGHCDGTAVFSVEAGQGGTGHKM